MGSAACGVDVARLVVERALELSDVSLPLKKVVVGIDGRIVEQA